MRATKLSVLALVPGAAMAQNLTQLLANTTQLSSLNSLLMSLPGVMKSVANLTNVTILAPSNEALGNYTNLSSLNLSSPVEGRAIGDLLLYHILQGQYYASNITDTPAFVPTLLNDTLLTNVTSGQVVEAITQDNKLFFYSGLLMNSTVTQAVRRFISLAALGFETDIMTEPQLHRRCCSRH